MSGETQPGRENEPYLEHEPRVGAPDTAGPHGEGRLTRLQPLLGSLPAHLRAAPSSGPRGSPPPSTDTSPEPPGVAASWSPPVRHPLLKTTAEQQACGSRLRGTQEPPGPHRSFLTSTHGVPVSVTPNPQKLGTQGTRRALGRACPRLGACVGHHFPATLFAPNQQEVPETGVAQKGSPGSSQH